MLCWRAIKKLRRSQLSLPHEIAAVNTQLNVIILSVCFWQNGPETNCPKYLPLDSPPLCGRTSIITSTLWFYGQRSRPRWTRIHAVESSGYLDQRWPPANRSAGVYTTSLTFSSNSCTEPITWAAELASFTVNHFPEWTTKNKCIGASALGKQTIRSVERGYLSYYRFCDKLLLAQNFTEIGNWLLSYGQNNDFFKIAVVRHLAGLKNFIFGSCSSHRVPNLHFCTKFQRNRMIIHWDMASSISMYIVHCV